MRTRALSRAILVVLFAGAAIGCDDSAAPTGMAARLELVSGFAPEATVSHTIPTPIVIRVTDEERLPVQGAQVALSPDDSSGVITPALALSDSHGLVQATWTAGPRPGALRATASLVGTMQRITLTATALPRVAARLILVSGDSQRSRTSRTLASSLAFRVVDAEGVAVSGELVRFTRTDASALLSPTASVSVANGLVLVSWTLGTQPGEQRVVASLSSIAASLTATAQALAPIATSLAIISGESQTGVVGQPLPLPITFKVTDNFGEPLSGASVVLATLNGSGSFIPSTIVSDEAGIARATWVLGALPAAMQAAVSIGGTAISIQAHASAVPEPTESLIAPRDTVGIIKPQQEQLRVTARDRFGNVISNPDIVWQSSDIRIASVSQEGVVTPVSAGRAIITATSGHASTAIVIVVAAF